MCFLGGVFIPEENINFKLGFNHILNNYSDSRRYKISTYGHPENEDSDKESRYQELIKYKRVFRENFLTNLVSTKGFTLEDSHFGYMPVVFAIRALKDSLESNGDYQVVYLFKPNRKGVFLNLMFVVTNFREGKNFKPEEYEKIASVRNKFREYIKDNLNNEKINLTDFNEDLDLEDENQLAIAYGKGSLFSKYYDFNDGECNTDEEQFVDDLNQFLDLSIEVDKFHQKFLEIKDSMNLNDVGGESQESDGSNLENNNEEPLQCEYWVYSPGGNADKWDEHYCNNIMAMDKPVGDLRKFNSEEEIRNKNRLIFEDGEEHPRIAKSLWHFSNTVKPGDIVFARNGVNKIIGQGIVESGYDYDGNQEYMHIRKVNWIERGCWDYGDDDTKLSQDTLVNITHNTKKQPNRLEIIKGFFKNDPINKQLKYTKKDFENEAFIDGDDYDDIVLLLRKYKNLILQGPPGVGKTFLAKRLADSMIGYRYSDRVEMVQFHQSYSYEDFIMGYKPAEKGFKLEEGPFYKFCKKAEECPKKDYFFIIDEINRGDLSKIFGELFMLIEDDKRGENYKVKLLYRDEEFSVPENVYIIGLMNTADRSIAMVDYALRRRFAFFDLEPGFNSKNFKKIKDRIRDNVFKGNDKNPFNEVIGKIESLNDAILGDDALNDGFRIGHSHFCNLDESKKSEEFVKELTYVIDYKILPLLREYWFDDSDNDEIEKLEKLSNRLKTNNKGE